jgi:hypothetical protein
MEKVVRRNVKRMSSDRLRFDVDRWRDGGERSSGGAG